MNSLRNQVQLIGYLGKDIELKNFDKGMCLAKAPVATSEYYRNSQGEKVQETQWHNVVAWGKTAELMSQLLHKGDEVALKGKLIYKSYKDAEGKARYSTEVVISEFIKMGAREKAAATPF